MFNPITRHPAARLAVAGTLIALLVTLVGNASAVSVAADRKASLRWDNKTFASAPALVAHLTARGLDADVFLRTHPAAVGELGLRAVTWNGQDFFTVTGVRSWSLRTGANVVRWMRLHPAAAATLRRNEGPRRQTQAFNGCWTSKCARPRQTTAPLASGTPAAGRAVTVSSGTWSGATPLQYSYRWQRCVAASTCSDIGGASSQTYTVKSADAGTSLRAVVRVRNTYGSASASSNLLAAVPVPQTAPVPPVPPAGTPAPVQAETPAPVPAGTPAPASTPAPTAPSNRFGIATGGNIEWANDANLARELDGYSQIGAGWIRFDLKWSAVEATRGTFNWTIYDRLIAEAHNRGLSVIANLAYTPSWARSAEATSNKFAPVNAADYANFARAAVARYAPKGVKHYEVWNEPNLSVFWKPAPDPAKYTELLIAAYRAMKSADASVQVLAGAFSPKGGHDDPQCGTGGTTVDINPLNFLEEMYANGAKGFFDAVSHHPYGGSAGPTGTHRCNAWFEMAGTSPSILSILAANGDQGKKIWATEFGTDLAWVGGSESAQASQISDAMRLWRSYSWAGGLMVYSYHQDIDGFNLVRSDWTQRQAWYAYQSAPKT